MVSTAGVMLMCGTHIVDDTGMLHHIGGQAGGRAGTTGPICWTVRRLLGNRNSETEIKRALQTLIIEKLLHLQREKLFAKN